MLVHRAFQNQGRAASPKAGITTVPRRRVAARDGTNAGAAPWRNQALTLTPLPSLSPSLSVATAAGATAAFGVGFGAGGAVAAVAGCVSACAIGGIAVMRFVLLSQANRLVWNAQGQTDGEALTFP